MFPASQGFLTQPFVFQLKQCHQLRSAEPDSIYRFSVSGLGEC